MAQFALAKALVRIIMLSLFRQSFLPHITTVGTQLYCWFYFDDMAFNIFAGIHSSRS